MDEYWSAALEPIHHAQQVSSKHIQTQPSLCPVNSGSGSRASSADTASHLKFVRDVIQRRQKAAPTCASCTNDVAIEYHYFRCAKFLQSKEIAKHGRYLCVECG